MNTMSGKKYKENKINYHAKNIIKYNSMTQKEIKEEMELNNIPLWILLDILDRLPDEVLCMSFLDVFYFDKADDIIESVVDDIFKEMAEKNDSSSTAE